MSVVLRGDIWWVRLQFNGEMIQKSTRFRYKDKALAQLYEDNLRRELALSGMSENNRRCEPSDTLAATDSIEAKSIDERLEDIVRIVETTAKSVEILAVSQRETKKEVSEITGLPSFRKRYISAKQVAEMYGFSERELDRSVDKEPARRFGVFEAPGRDLGNRCTKFAPSKNGSPSAPAMAM